MGVGAGLSMYVVVVQKFTFAISSPDEFLCRVAGTFVFVNSNNLPQRLLAVVAVIYCGRLTVVALDKWPVDLCVWPFLSHVTGEVVPLSLRSVSGWASAQWW